MAYNTGNPSGSSDPRDLSDSSADIDTWATSTTADTHPDRLGTVRKTWRGMENEFDADQSARASEYADDKVYRDTTYDNAQADRAQRFDLFLANCGYQFAGDYAAGIELTEYNQVLRDVSGNLWRVSASTSLPYTTTGAGLPEGGAFIAIGDADLAQNLISDPSTGQGALLVRGSVIYVDTIADLQALPTSELVDGHQVAVSESGNVYKWDSVAAEFVIINGRTVGADGKIYQLVAAVLRQNTKGSGWYALDDTNHTPIGIASVSTSTDGYDIAIDYNFSAKTIGGLNVTSDESFAGYPMWFGPSVGKDNATISFYHNWSLRTSGTGTGGYTQAVGDPGVHWDATVDSAAGTITVTHGSSAHSDSSGWPVFAQLLNSEDSALQIRVVAQSRSGYTLQNYGPIAADVFTSLTVYKDCAETITASWDTDTLTITHPTAQSTRDAHVTCRDPQYNAAVVNNSKTNTQIQFYDIATDTAYSGSTPPATVRFSRSASVCKYPIAGGTATLSMRAGPVLVPASNIYGSTRNLWLMGVFEVDSA